MPNDDQSSARDWTGGNLRVYKGEMGEMGEMGEIDWVQGGI